MRGRNRNNTRASGRAAAINWVLRNSNRRQRRTPPISWASKAARATRAVHSCKQLASSPGIWAANNPKARSCNRATRR